MESKNKYTWIIGDVHGMFDHLNCLTDYLNNFENEQIIFLGDIIDRGPSSKQVIEKIINLPDKYICLLGNHEHMMLDELLSEKNDVVLPKLLWEFNGGDKTIRSLGFNNIAQMGKNLPETYLKFFQNFKISHKHTLLINNRLMSFIAVHAGFYPYKPLEEQLKFKNYTDFSAYFAKKENDHSNSPVWIRNSFFDANPNAFGKNIIIHGHTPTQKLRYYCTLPPADEEDCFSVINPDSYIPDLPFIRKQLDNNEVTSIDIDTGASAGKRLTAMGICLDNIEKTDNGDALRLEFVQIDASKGFASSNTIKLFDYLLDINDNSVEIQ